MNTAPLNTAPLNGAASTVLVDAVFGVSAGDGGLSAALDFAAVMNSAAVGAPTMGVGLIFAADVRGVADANPSASASAIFHATLRAIVTGLSTAPVDGAEAAWAVNTDTGGSTRYEHYAFNSFAVIDGVAYGARNDGLYRLDGNDDDGLPIQAMVSFGRQSFGTTALKRVTNAYLGVASTGRLFLKVLADGADYTYATRGASEHLMTQRVDVGRGLRASLVEFELYNADGDDFELASVEFVAAALNRRI